MRPNSIVLIAGCLLASACNPADEQAVDGNATANAAASAEGGVTGGNAPAGTAGNATAGTAGNAAAAAQPVAFRGCPILRDVEGGCLVVQSGGATYDINSAQPRPDPAQRLVIEGTGVPGGASFCMTGTVLTDIQWHYTKAKCSDEEKKDG